MSLMSYQPPYTITNQILSLVAQISECLGRLSVNCASPRELKLRKVNRVRTIQGSLAIEGNELTQEQITALLNGKRILAPKKQVQEALNAINVYQELNSWSSHREVDLLQAHEVLMIGLQSMIGRYRMDGVGVFKDGQVLHMAPPAERVPKLMSELFHWLANDNSHPLIRSCVFHYEFEFIHPFSDGNGRMGRLWQTLILSEWNPLFAHLPVESFIYDNQQTYYDAINRSTLKADSEPFISFMLQMVLNALQETEATTPQDAPQVNPQVKQLLEVLEGEMLREEIQAILGLKDRKSFRDRYLKPALEAGLIEMTLPDKPTSKVQRYRKKKV
ncbi:Fic family protein [Vibrio cholerae]|uniref:Fic family protein n=1 Tax=Vibrio cholerae TaxID=666 RepID=UPI0024790CB8|nr:Fic family protein [Vibrio cholerae]MDH7616624.1 Fic family protein [Vibrio cholerae]